MESGLIGRVFLGGTGRVGVANVGKPRVVVRDERRSPLFGIGCPCREQGGAGVVSGSGRACFCLSGLDNEGPSQVFLVAFPGGAMPWSLPAPKERFLLWIGLRIWRGLSSLDRSTAANTRNTNSGYKVDQIKT